MIAVLLLLGGLAVGGARPPAGQDAGPPGVAAAQDVDTLSLLRSVLHEIRAEHPAVPVVLSQSRSDAECLPHCGGTGPREHHPPHLLRSLASDGLVQATCWVPDGTLGCDTPRPGHLLVALGPVRGPSTAVGSPAHSAVVTVVTYRPCPTGCRFPDASAYRYLLGQDAEGAWKVVKRLPVWIA